MEKTFYLSPIGLIEICGSEKGISTVLFDAKVDTLIEHPSCLRDCVKQLDEYFNKKRKIFDLPFDLSGTEFQLKVWNELLKIPYGAVCSYIDIAKRIGNKPAVRAVGSANGKKPISIIIPCHRVIGNDGSLVGYGGGIWRKKYLLELESEAKQTNLFF
ncbi:MAG TPA: methylated-DNA--[protein]-cysteine S-methyltransferase [Bacteroidales bacterium]|nr:methylated-DNA--[protein]-cysteine S-methyltransferase [Bacteroidales bacterium]HQI45212.1 methylated-DNA--[protein]-cysteine S-methyltransferase [Bacteroidales bacterium]